MVLCVGVHTRLVAALTELIAHARESLVQKKKKKKKKREIPFVFCL
jgi:hypothetical protein